MGPRDDEGGVGQKGTKKNERRSNDGEAEPHGPTPSAHDAKVNLLTVGVYRDSKIASHAIMPVGCACGRCGDARAWAPRSK